jgi:hypothetical protein
MRYLNPGGTAIAFFSAGALALALCSSETKAQPSTTAPADRVTSTVTTQPGVAGGVIEETFTTTVTISAVEPSTRNVSLTAADGTKASFTAGPEIRNFDQIHVGDKLTATITQRLVVFVRGDGADPSVTHAAALARAPKGAKPGAIVAESYEIVASVKSIDATNRTAVLQFSDGQTKTIPVRSDVDLSKYKVGDSVVIRVTEALSLLVRTP